jgi:VanZ family protein
VRAGQPLTRAILLVVLGIALFGALDEWHQQFIPGRSMELFDWMADLTGATIGTVVAILAPRVRERSEA